MNQELRQLDILIGATQFQIRKAQEVFDSIALLALQEQYRSLVQKRFTLLQLTIELDEVSHE